jgi:phage regulator Rha-like protein
MDNNAITLFNSTSQDNQVNSLIINENGQFFTTSQAIAMGTNTEHASVLKLIRNFQKDLEEFGAVGFKIEPLQNGGIPRQIANLNENQATLLMTFMRNSDVVVKFKVRLVKAFHDLAQQNKQAPVVKELSRMDLIQLAMDAEKENQELRALNTEQVKVITEQKDVIEAQEDFIDSAFKLHDTMSVDYYCKLISNKHNHFGAVKFRSLMKISGRFVKNRDSDSYMPSQEMLNTGQMEYKAKEPYVDCYGVTHEHTQIRITKKGARTLYAICKKYQNFFKLNDNETKGYHYKPLCERREFLNSLLLECK